MRKFMILKMTEGGSISGPIQEGDTIALLSNIGYRWAVSEGGRVIIKRINESNSRLVINSVPGTPGFTSMEFSLRTSDGLHYVKQASAIVDARSIGVGHWQTFTLYDLNAGSLRDNDRIYIRTPDGHYVAADGGGGYSVSATTETPCIGAEFRIKKHAAGGSPDGTSVISYGDTVSLVCLNEVTIGRERRGCVSQLA